MLDTINVGIPIVGSKGWLGGVSYIELLVKAVTSLPQDSRPKLFLIVQEESLPDLPLHEAIIPLFNGIIFVGNYQGELPDGIIHIESFPALFKALNFYYPVLSDVWPGVRAASWIPDFQHMYLPQFFSEADLKMRSNAFARIAAQAQLVVFSSNDALRDFHRFFPQSKAVTRVLPFYALPQENWYAGDFLETQQLYGLPDLFVICCNQIWTHKNHECLFEAIAALHDQQIDLHLVCTGSTTDYRNPDYFPRLKDLIRTLGIEHLVHIVGNIPRNDQIQLIRRSSAVVQPSLFEGWSTVVEDCRALGKTILLSDLLVHREQAPRHGVYFDRTSSASLAQAIREMMPELRPGPDAVRECQARDEAYTLADAFGRRFCAIVQESLQLPFGTLSKAPPLPQSSSAFPESALAHKWLDGLIGLEIGSSAHNPFGLTTRNVGLRFEGYLKEQCELTGKADTIHIVAPADDIPIPDDSEDFVLSSHVIEHCPDMIKALVEWYRVIKPGGYLYMIIPFRDAAPTDKGRPLTEWSHFFADYVNRITEKEEPEANGIPFGYGHYHVFEINNLHSFVQKTFGARLELVDHQNQDDKIGNGFTLVYRKQKSFADSFPWNLSDGGRHFEIRRPIAGEEPAIPTDRIVVAANLVPFRDLATRQRQDACITSIDALSSKGVVPLNICFRDELLEPAGWQLAPVLQQSADVKLGIEGKRKPFVTDLFDSAATWASEQGMSWFMLTNSDIIFTERLLTAVRACLSKGYETIAISRNEVERIDPNQGLVPGYLEINGYDVFVCQTDWWRQNRSRFQPYIYGERAWDDAYAAIMACHSRFIMLYEDGLCFHFKHPTEWISGLYADYNMGIYTGVDKQYSDRYEAFVKEVIDTDKVLLSQKVNHLLKKYFTLSSVAETVKTAPHPDSAFVNIGMVTYNRLEFTRQAIDALLLHTDSPYLLTVVDNNSQDGTRQYLKSLKALGVIGNLVLLEENVGVAKASNLAWSLEPQADYYLKLDNDIVMQKPGWLHAMVTVADRVPDAGAVAYNFEPNSYPLVTLNGVSVRQKLEGNLGGACILIPRRTHDRLGFWCEDYGLYSEEDFDYGVRVHLAGLRNLYMADEEVGFHLPAGRAARINENTLVAGDGVEEEIHPEYRRWKDDLRRENLSSGRVKTNMITYCNKPESLLVHSPFVIEYQKAQLSPPHGSPVPLKTIKVAVVTSDPLEHACGYYRIRTLFAALPELEKLNGIEVLNGKRVPNYKALQQADVILVQRFFPQPTSRAFLDELLTMGKPLIYEADDLLTEVPESNPHHDFAVRCVPIIHDFARKCTAVTVSTSALKEGFAPDNDNIFVLPNLLDPSIWNRTSPPPKGPLVIGFAGTVTHEKDIEELTQVLEALAAKYPGAIAFTFMGCASDRLSLLPGFTFIPFDADYMSYAARLQTIPFDIMLVPLEDTPFNRCKSNVKWLEYSACGIAGVYADLPPYNDCVQHGKTGLLVGPTPQQWFEAIDLLIKQPALRHGIARAARQEVLSAYTLNAHGHSFGDAYRAIMAGRMPPAVSIVIPLFNKVELTRHCLEHLAKNTDQALFELILVDNGSSDGTAAYLATLPPSVKLVRNAVNQGFAKACNQGAALAKGRYLLFLNNDTEPLPGWLEPLIAVLDADPGVAAAGSKLLFPDGTIQHAGVILAKDHSSGDPMVALHIYYKKPAAHPEANVPFCYQALTAACLAVRREAFAAVDGFDEGYWNGYEDVDLCFKLSASGAKLVYQPESVLIHFESQSGSERFTKVNDNVRRLHQKWLGKVPLDLEIAADGTMTLGPGLQGPYRPGGASQRTPKVSIVIPAFNQACYTKKCLEALFAVTGRELTYEVIVVDNASSDWTPEYLTSLEPRIRVLSNDRNLGFAKACNQGAQAALGRFLVFLNNDTLPKPGWLQALVKEAESGGADLVGAKLLYPDGTVQHAGVGFADPGDGVHLFKGMPGDHPAVNHKRFMQCVTGACLLLERQLFLQLGGFDEGFVNGYEDVDLCLRAQAAGQKILYTPESVLVHFEETSAGRKEKDRHNAERFFARWGGRIRFDNLDIYEAEGLLRPIGEEQADRSWALLGANDNAVFVYLNVLLRYPQDAGALLNLGRAYAAVGRPADARLFLERLLEMRPGQPAALRELARLSTGAAAVA